MNTVLVAGATSFLGYHVAKRLNSAGIRPRVLELPESRAGVLDRLDVERCPGGHHASCTCAIGAEAGGGVLTSDFKVHHTEGLRVVDASVFPRAPGLFIVSAIYIIGEKAADAIIASARTGT